MGFLFAILIYGMFYALVLMAAAAILVLWGFLWVIGFVFGALFMVFGQRRPMEWTLEQRPPRPVPQAKWSNRR